MFAFYLWSTKWTLVTWSSGSVCVPMRGNPNGTKVFLFQGCVCINISAAENWLNVFKSALSHNIRKPVRAFLAPHQTPALVRWLTAQTSTWFQWGVLQCSALVKHVSINYSEWRTAIKTMFSLRFFLPNIKHLSSHLTDHQLKHCCDKKHSHQIRMNSFLFLLF